MPQLLLMLFLPLLLLTAFNATAITQAVTAAQVDIQKAVETSARAGAMQIVPDSQAAGRPRINTANAHTEFRHQLAENLGLDPVTLNPLHGSGVKRPDYAFVVYNTDSLFEDQGAPLCKKYLFRNGALTEYELYPDTPAATFAITENDIQTGTGQTNTTLDRPGTVALVKTEMARVAGKNPEVVSRWVSAKVVKTAPGPW